MSGHAKAISNDELWGGGQSPFSISYGKMMMWFFLVSDALTFGGLLTAYGFIRHGLSDAWPVGEQVFEALPFLEGRSFPLIYVALMTFILIISSVTMVLAVEAGHRMDQKGVVKWLGLTIIGGFFFLGSQAWEWSHFIHGSGGSFQTGSPITVASKDDADQTVNVQLATGTWIHFPSEIGHKIEHALDHGDEIELLEGKGQILIKHAVHDDHHGDTHGAPAHHEDAHPAGHGHSDAENAPVAHGDAEREGALAHDTMPANPAAAMHATDHASSSHLQTVDEVVDLEMIAYKYTLEHTEERDYRKMRVTGAEAEKLWAAMEPNTMAFGATLSRNEYGPKQYAQFFFFITGFHGFHVMQGVLINIIVWLMAIRGVFQRRGHYEMVEKIGLFWHFVDLVWVFVFTFYYLV